MPVERCRPMTFPLMSLAHQVVDEEVLGDDGVAFHAHHLGDVRDAGASRRADGPPETTTSMEAQIISRIVRDGSEKPPIVIMDVCAGQRFARVVGVQRAHRSVMAGVHRLQQVEGFRSADFADDDAFGAAYAGSCGPDRAW